MYKRLVSTIARGALAACALMLPGAAQAACNIEYSVQPGDTFYSIAEKHYGDRQRWTMIYYNNQDRLSGPAVLPGNTLFIPCIEGVTEADATPLLQDDAEMKLLTGGAYPPFTDQGLPGKGMITELVNAALELAPSPVSYSITWEDDWSKHLFPMLNDKKFDMGFPWYKPDCATTPDNERCANFHFSEPLMLVPIMLFVRADAPFEFTKDADILGRTICRAKGYFTHDLDRADRRWLTENLINFVVGDTPRHCMEMVMSGDVDAATMNLFLGADLLIAMKLRDRVIPLERPLSEEGLHVIISKRHWRGTTHLYRINAGLKNLKKDGRYQEIVSRHLEVFWSKLQ